MAKMAIFFMVHIILSIDLYFFTCIKLHVNIRLLLGRNTYVLNLIVLMLHINTVRL